VSLRLLGGDVELKPAPSFTRGLEPSSRMAYAAAHVVPRVTAENTPGSAADIDWDSTLAFRHHLWSWGLGVADAMDTAQRNMGLDWPACTELIRRSAAEAATVKGRIVVGVNTDHVAEESISLAEVITAYREQLAVAEDAGAGVVLMASRHLARAASSAADYERVYREVLRSASAPVVLHWLGEAFDARLAGYFGVSPSDTVIRIIEDNVNQVSGIKMSLLDADAERSLRSRLPEGVRMFTGDDFNYVDLIASGSDALLGAFAAVAPNASAAITALDRDDEAEFRRILLPTQQLARQVFAAPTQYYKTGVAFLAWLNGHQPAFQMVGGLQSARSLAHLNDIVRLANEAQALEQPQLAADRWRALLEVNGL
jgi:dihydrodipicolinate synthase/N-acetylneuraminate lyase